MLLTKVEWPARRRGAVFEDPFAGFTEWDFSEDDEDFADILVSEKPDSTQS